MGPCGPALFFFLVGEPGQGQASYANWLTVSIPAKICISVHVYIHFLAPSLFPLDGDVNGKSLEPNRNHVELICLESRVQAIEKWKKRLTG